jgi:uncharacterized protein YhfF
MENYHHTVHDLWKEFIEVNPEYSNSKYKAWYFCDTEDCANKLAELVKQGIKRGTTSLYRWYEAGKETLPVAGDLNVITNWDGTAQCITKTIKVTVLPFRDVDEELAFIEGEGDKSLDYWRKAHINFFTRELTAINVEFSEDVMVVFEEFEKIYGS